jgi:uncharacterized protein HemX
MERGARFAKAAFISIAVAIALAGCDDTRALKNRAEAAEQKLAQLQERLEQAELEASRAHEYRRAAAIAEACDVPMVWRLCPAQSLAVGKAALANQYTPDQGVYWAARIGLLAALAAVLAIALATAYLLWLRVVAPAEEEVEEARRLVESAQAEARRWQSKADQAQRAARAAGAELERMQEQKERLKSELSSLQAELEQTRSDLDALRGGFL